MSHQVGNPKTGFLTSRLDRTAEHENHSVVIVGVRYQDTVDCNTMVLINEMESGLF